MIMTKKSKIDQPLTVELSRSGKTGASSSDVSLVSKVVNAHHHFKNHRDTIHIEFVDGTMVLTGRLPSFYLKQLLQETVRHVAGVQRIQNDIDVVCCDGVSSTRD